MLSDVWFYTSQLYSEIFDHFRLIALPIFITHIYKNTFISVFLGDSTHVVGYRINSTVSPWMYYVFHLFIVYMIL